MFELSLKCRCSTVAHSQSALPRSSKFYLPEAKAHYSPDRLIDVEHIKLDIAVDLKKKWLGGTCLTRFIVQTPTVAKLKFDAVDLKVSKVTDPDGKTLEFNQSSDSIFVLLNRELKCGERSEVTFTYEVTEPRAGLYFVGPNEFDSKRPNQLWTQGEDQDNRYWIPCHDAPNEKATTEMLVTVEEHLTVISNGGLVAVKHDSARKKKTFHWSQKIPHASYLITLCVGDFVELKDEWKNSKGELVPVNYFTVKGREEETKVSFEKTPKMIEFFSKKIGVDYPYEKYAQVVAWDFIYGGMENTSATTQTEYTLHPREIDLDHSSEPLVAHELAHQWFGDLLTCKEWSHAWLNEGFATYFESLWMDYEHGRDEFLYELFLNEKNYKTEDLAYRRPVVTNLYLAPADIFDRHLYEKGGRILHMLRAIVGDDMWWKSIKRYVELHHAKTVETVDLQRAFEETTGRALSWFFDQWIFHGGHPELKVQSDWNVENKTLKITVKQTQRFDELTPFFRIPIQVKVMASNLERVWNFEMNQAEESFWISLNEKPQFVSINPGNTVLCKLDFSPSREALLTQLRNDSDVMGRVFAAQTLAKDHSWESAQGLAEALKNELFWGAQAEICDALANIGTNTAVKALEWGMENLKHPKARARAVRALGSLKLPAQETRFEQALREDPSPLVQYEAGVAIGKTQSKKGFERLVNLLGKRPSWHDYSDRGILMGLAEHKNEPKVFDLVHQKTKKTETMFLRRDALGALLKWSAANPQRIIEEVLDLARDDNYFVRISAVDGLADLGSTKALGALGRLVDSVVEPRTRRAALMARKALLDGHSSSEEVEKLKAAYDKLQEQYREILNRLEKLEPRATTIS